jgi:Ser/Thr protein kinase RdoA (MazF antagonist)
MPDDAPEDVVAALRRMGVLGAEEQPGFTRLTGGVSSDIWRVDLAAGPIAVKRALAKLRVEQAWYAPVERNAFEAAWMRRAAEAVPEAVPALLGQDQRAGVLAMAYLDPATHRLWKEELIAGRVDLETAAAVGDRLGRIHAATADDRDLARRIPTDRIFYEIRLEPYLVATGRAHPDLAGALQTLIEVTAGTRRCLVHGDVSPKNILIGPSGPVFLDAECAWYGDPAFDLAFCLNHLLLKSIRRPETAPSYLEAFFSLTERYFVHLIWESRREIEGRVARLLPALFLARVDGKSPVEYLTDETDREMVRRVARGLMLEPRATPVEVGDALMRELGR